MGERTAGGGGRGGLIGIFRSGFASTIEIFVLAGGSGGLGAGLLLYGVWKVS